MQKSVYTTESIGEIIQNMETNFISGGGVSSSKYVTSDLYEDISRIYAYLESKHITGDIDSLDREKPFFNIVLASRNIWFRATDIDRKNILITPSKTTDVLGAFMAYILLQNWMKKEKFGSFLNDWGLELASFNSCVVKFVEQNKRMIPSVVPWSRLIVDQIDFKNNPQIEVLELTKGQLLARDSYDREKVTELCDALEIRKTTDGINKDNKTGYIKLYEIHGLFSEAQYKQSKGLTVLDGDENQYSQQMYVVSFAKNKEGKEESYILYCGKEEKSPYLLTSLLPATDGSISLNGSVKNLFDSQWMVNHTVKSIKDQLDLASKLIFQTADGNFVGQNALNSIETGDILIHEINKPLTQINNGSHDITSNQSYNQMWKSLGNEINGISESMMGINPPSGTAWRQTEALLNESHSLFEIMTENKGLAIEEMMREFVLLFLKKQIDTKEEIVATLDMHGIKQIEERYIKNTAIKNVNDKKLDILLNYKFDGTLNEQLDQIPNTAQEEERLKQELAIGGQNRFFKPSEVSDKTWKELLKDLEWQVEVEVGTDPESVDKKAILSTLNTALTTVMNPAFGQNKKAQYIVDKILTETGRISPIELDSIPSYPMETPQLNN